MKPQLKKKESSANGQHEGRSHEIIGERPSAKPVPEESGSEIKKLLCYLSLFAVLAGGIIMGEGTKERAPASTDNMAAVSKEERKELNMSKLDKDEVKTAQVREQLSKGIVPEELKETSVEIREKIMAGTMSMYKLTVLDTVAEDGDVVGVAVNGNAIGHIRLSNAGAHIHVPLIDQTTQILKIEAKVDGGGGVTFGARSNTGKTMSKNMKVGEVETWVVTF